MIYKNAAIILCLASGALISFSAAAHATISLSGEVTYYNSFSESYGNGITFSNPFASQAFTSIKDTKDYGGVNRQTDWSPGIELSGAKFVGTIDASASRNYQFDFGVDDAAYLFVNGSSTPTYFIGGENNFDQSGAPRNIQLSLNSGANPFVLEYANEIGVQAALVFSSVQNVSAVPEISTWVMTLAGFAGLGALGYRQSRRKDKATVSAA